LLLARFARLAYIPVQEFESIWDDSVTNNQHTSTKALQVCDAIRDFVERITDPAKRSFSYFSTDVGLTSVKQTGDAGGDVYIFCKLSKLLIDAVF